MLRPRDAGTDPSESHMDPREGVWLVWDSGTYLWSVLVVLVGVSA